MSELTRIHDARRLLEAPLRIVADATERAALARRFGLVGIERLIADVTLTPDGAAVLAAGTLDAAVTQSCAISGEDLAVIIAERIALRFVPASAPPHPDEEIELDAGALDEIEMDGSQFDLGEAVAQSLALAIDPFAIGPMAEEARRQAGIVDQAASGPFAELAKLKK